MIDRSIGHREVLRRLAEAEQPTSYLEVGVLHGASLAAVLDGCPRVGHVALCDTWERNRDGNHGQVFALLKRRKYEGRITWLGGRSQDLLPGMSMMFDMVHIDGDHEEEAALADLENGWALTRQLMVVHDVVFSTVKAAMARFGIEPGHLFTGDTGTAVYWR